MTYERWDIETRNIVGANESERAVLAVVRGAVCRHGDQYADTLALVREDTSGHVSTLAVGSELAKRAEAKIPTVLLRVAGL